ncbi:catalase [Colletotrichum tofieldiae]|nr:catalase [Colletotrichum tofieldiae]
MPFYRLQADLRQPMFFYRDPVQGLDVIRSQSRNPQNFFFDWDALFDLLANTPEANYKPCTDLEAVRMCGEDPDYSKRDIWEAIEKGEEIEWTAHVQVMQPHDANPDGLGFDPFDVTKVWTRDKFLMKEFGRLVLNKNPENFHRDVKQAAFSPSSMVPGIEDSPDPLLQFRMFLYHDAQYHRIGINLHQIPVNCPFMAKSYATLNFDGQMRTDANHADNKQYAPNSFAHKIRPDVAEAPYAVNDNIASRKSYYWHEGKKNDYQQARQLWAKTMSDQQRKHTASPST